MHSFLIILTGLTVAGTLLHAGETRLLNDAFLAKVRNCPATIRNSVGDN